MRLDRYREARESLAKVLELEPDHPHAQNEIEAIEEFERGI